MLHGDAQEAVNGVKDSVLRKSFPSLLLKDRNAYHIYKETQRASESVSGCS